MTFQCWDALIDALIVLASFVRPGSGILLTPGTDFQILSQLSWNVLNHLNGLRGCPGLHLNTSSVDPIHSSLDHPGCILPPSLKSHLFKQAFTMNENVLVVQNSLINTLLFIIVSSSHPRLSTTFYILLCFAFWFICLFLCLSLPPPTAPLKTFEQQSCWFPANLQLLCTVSSATQWKTSLFILSQHFAEEKYKLLHKAVPNCPKQ